MNLHVLHASIFPSYGHNKGSSLLFSILLDEAPQPEYEMPTGRWSWIRRRSKERSSTRFSSASSHGPHLPRQRQSEHVPIPIDDCLHLQLVELIAEKVSIADVGRALLDYVAPHPISWTLWRATLLFFIDTFDNEDAILFEYDTENLCAEMQRLASAEAWEVLHVNMTIKQENACRTIEECHEWCDRVLSHEHIGLPVPRKFGCHTFCTPSAVEGDLATCSTSLRRSRRTNIVTSSMSSHLASL